MSEPEPLHRNRERASSFGAVAERYDRSRPSYPAAMLDDLCATGPRTALDVGCGTGILARQLAARGLEVLGVEPDPQMADVARRSGVRVEVGAIESWEPAGRRFDLLTAGQAWHWVEPVAGARKAASVVAPGGAVALAWNMATIPEPLRTTLDELYARRAPTSVRPTVLHRPGEWSAEDSAERALTATGAFGACEPRTYPWSRTYTTEEWLDQLETHSDHRLMDAGERAELLAAVARAIDAEGGSFEMAYVCHVSFLRRTPTG